LKLGEAKPIKDDRFKITGLLWFGHTACCGWSRCEGNRKRVFFQPFRSSSELAALAFLHFSHESTRFGHAEGISVRFPNL